MIDRRSTQIHSQILRVEKIFEELAIAYKRDLENKSISDEALVLTHEVVEKCANILDQTMTLVFETKILPKLSEPPKRGGYFPAAKNEDSYLSGMGQWKVKDLGAIDADLDAALRSLQPFSAKENEIYARIRDLASKKHTALEPQVRREQPIVTTVGHSGNSVVRWNPNNVTFGAGVRISGVPVNPHTQMPIEDPQLSIRREVWVSFHLAGTGEDAYRLCYDAVNATKRAVKLLLESK
ncbi:hypothetical protein [Pseudothioclava nitratireducens]|uniref:hypothetical protein n=1 Tax=Pseudothioclava nitratireducens TaxID=1928646 RepID=UPI0023DB114F|nr:hypothetical protein [Defluviimonas nitratireducens]MDF1620989.1 hypothetical protein [Defluviimonas nitratireducens]